MNSFVLFLLAVIALIIFLVNLGPLILFAAGVLLLYVIFKQFMKTESTGAKVFWVISGLIILSMTVSNIYALAGVLALYILYLIFKKDKEKPEKARSSNSHEDPFTNFEREWADLKK
ncbi:flagellar basal body rod protein [Salipaludibacillus sp. CUR1]|uniref:lmo0954 family membrane protein n=1 Tax=Salipaludibacillus sp. CUR1 TaxID=2820003 RepID=UPI001E53F384|nr:flagellar basal body rod protein [Salipaludibacillus sp. CUR1]MCE7793485.1 flagellar basal body rod protein [Salipaludibacillus sp. CUR1]